MRILFVLPLIRQSVPAFVRPPVPPAVLSRSIWLWLQHELFTLFRVSLPQFHTLLLGSLIDMSRNQWVAAACYPCAGLEEKTHIVHCVQHDDNICCLQPYEWGTLHFPLATCQLAVASCSSLVIDCLNPCQLLPRQSSPFATLPAFKQTKYVASSCSQLHAASVFRV